MGKTNSSGFTLIEVIVSLVLVGIMATVAGLGLVQATRSFLFAREVGVLTQKSHYAMARMRKSILNMQSGSYEKISDTAFKVVRNGQDECFSLDPASGKLYLSDDDTLLTKYLLADRISSFSPGAIINSRVTLTLGVKGDNSPAISFTDTIYPRNQAPSDADLDLSSLGMDAGSMGAFCFIRTALNRQGDSPAVRLFRQFRDQYLLDWSGGRKLVAFYYRNSPGWAGHISGSPLAGSVVRLLLLPCVGMVFLLLYYPVGLIAFPCIAWLLTRLFTGVVKARKGFMPLAQGASGSILIGLIITMLIMAVLGAAMVTMFSSTLMNTTTSGLTQRAYYLAESGYHYALGQKKESTTDSDFISTLNLGGNITLQGGQFSFQMETYWYDISTQGTSMMVTVPGGTGSGVTIPNTVQSGDVLPFVFTNVSNGTQNLASCRVSSRGDDSMRLTPTTALGFIPDMTWPVLPGAFPAAAQTLNATEWGTASSNSLRLAGPVDALPPKNGVIWVIDGNAKPWVLQYDALVNNDLTGIHYYNDSKGPDFPSGGIQVTANTVISFVQFAKIDITGRVNPGGLDISQTISYFQPLLRLPSRVSGGGAAPPVRSIMGSHSRVTQGGHEMIKVDQTQSTYAYMASENIFQQESLAVVDWSDLNESNFLRDLWRNSDNRLSYDLQAKIKFTATEDDTLSDTTSEDFYINHPGCYMPGISFRTKGPNSGSEHDWVYYGLSIMRGIQGRSDPIETGSGCEISTYRTEEDDISDNLFANHGSNRNTARISTCSESDFTPATWDDEPPLDGIPYLVLWQKNVSQRPAGCSWVEYSPWEWLSYVPLLEYEEVTLHYYYPLERGVKYYYNDDDSFELNSDDYTERYETLQEGQIPGDRRNQKLGTKEDGAGCDPEFHMYSTSYKAYKLKDPYNLFGTTTVDGVTILGHFAPHFQPQAPGDPVRDPGTIDRYAHEYKGKPVSKWGDDPSCPVGYIVKPLSMLRGNEYPDFANTKEKYRNFAARANYRIYPKPWVTLLAKVYEMEGDLDCDPTTGDNGQERVNAISAFITSPDDLGSNENKKDSIRRGQGIGTFHWPEDGDYFTKAVWGKGLADKKKGYTSKVIDKPSWMIGCVGSDIKSVEIGRDDDDDPVTTFTGTFTTEDYNFTTEDIPEFGLHTLGISSPDPNDINGNPNIPTGAILEAHRETVYFADFYWSVVGEKNALLPGMQSQ
ncbi:MAG: prepilin-type N-terminal cleavage/methylation domain-containing protein [Desulfobacterium sp.]|nr:prepilin-type N-terminal cleavage/methylation domain-containing protein [Desulfobacterium sp.]